MNKQNDNKDIGTPLLSGGTGGRLNYNFLLKPIFFIFSLLFATWLVVEIEKISPSDFGKHTSYASQELNNSENFRARKKYLESLCAKYKAGMIDSTELNKKLAAFLESTEHSTK